MPRGLVTLLLALAIFVVAAPGALAQKCVPRSNVEAIVDDSGSMADTDPRRLRVDAIELFTQAPSNDKKTFGAIEFGSDGAFLFGPGPISAFRAQMVQIAQQRLNADNGGTNYNEAFKDAAAHNPNANARIFLTDGAHTASDPYADVHKGGPPTYVLGLTQQISPADETRLQQIANDTGGIYRRAATSDDLTPAMADLQTAIDCGAPNVTYTDFFTRPGQILRHKLTIPGGITVVQFVLSWTNLADYFDIANLRLIQKGKTVGIGTATASRKRRRVRRLKVTKRRGRTFVAVKVRGLKKGKLTFKLKAKRLATPGGARLVTQGSRRRK